MTRILHVVGARPNYMKVAPVMREMARYPEEFEQVLVHTGQHYDERMSRVFFEELDLPRPDVNLGVGSGSHAQQTARIMERFEPVVLEYGPDWVFVPGDVNSTVACALVATKLGTRVAHIEAGLRSFDRTMPEEVNRVVTDHLSDLLFTSEASGNDNLAREGIAAAKICFVGNTMIDSLEHLLPKAEERWRSWETRFAAGGYVLVTFHRPHNVDDAGTLAGIVSALDEISRRVPVVFPLHPRTRKRVGIEAGSSGSRTLHLVEPLGYLDFLALQTHARLVITDSGGIQEETTYLGVPCLTARPNTERPVTIVNGTNRLITSTREAIVNAAAAVLDRAPRSCGDQPARPELWDGKAAQRVVHHVRLCAS